MSYCFTANRCVRKCHCTCDDDDDPSPPTSDISTLILGKNIHFARRHIYPNIRVIIRNGEHLVITMEYDPHRINVETVNDVIVRTFRFY